MCKKEVNEHLEHLEDLILNEGVRGVYCVIDYLQHIYSALSGTVDSDFKISVKFDGAPAIFSGIDPVDQQFFVAKKSIFNATPKVYKTEADIDADTSGSLKRKLKLALNEFRKLEIEGVIQGDFLYSKEDLREVDIDGKPYLTFHPNTIVYAVPKDSQLVSAILASRIGVVWHTAYRGDSFETMSANFGETIEICDKVGSVWSPSVTYNNIVSFSDDEILKFNERIADITEHLKSINHSTLKSLSLNSELLIRVKAYMNSKIRNNEGLKTISVDDMIARIAAHYQAEIDSRSTTRGKVHWITKRDDVMQWFNISNVHEIFVLYGLIIDIKHMIIDKLNESSKIHTFLKTTDGYVKTNHEGYVISYRGKNPVKLVNRSQFSHANFSHEVIKGFQSDYRL